MSGVQTSVKRMLWLGGLALGMTACGPGFKPEQYTSPQTLLEASKAAMDRGDCGGAIRGFTRVTFELPPRDHGVVEARYYTGVCHFREGEYLEAARAFRRVSDEFPDDSLAPQALLEAGEAQARLWKSPDLDPTYGQTALATLQEFLQRYPQSGVADSARAQIAALNDRFAQKALKNGEFYFRLRAYDSAIIYFRSVVAQYPDSRFAPAALLKLVDTYHRIGYADEARETCAHLRRFYAKAPGVASACPADSAPS